MDDRRPPEQTVPLGSLQAIAHQPRLSLLVHHLGGVEAVALGPGQSIVVGRARPSEVAVPDPSLSRQHARFTWREEGVEVPPGQKVRFVVLDHGAARPAERVSLLHEGMGNDYDVQRYMRLTARAVGNILSILGIGEEEAYGALSGTTQSELGSF